MGTEVKGVRRRTGRDRWRGLAAGVLIALLLGAYTWRTIDRNWDWEDEERLFRAALKARSILLPKQSFDHHDMSKRAHTIREQADESGRGLYAKWVGIDRYHELTSSWPANMSEELQESPKDK